MLKNEVNLVVSADMGSVVGSNVNISNVTTKRMDSTTFRPEATSTLSEREQLKIEFYKTYDVMTGVRIAATLGGFFGLMILLLVYKSRQVIFFTILVFFFFLRYSTKCNFR